MSYDPTARIIATNASTVAAQALALAQAAINGGSGAGGGSGNGSAAGQNWQVVATNTLAQPGEALSVDTTAAPIVITLPATGGTVSLRDNAATWGANTVTVVGNGLLIGGQTTMTLDAPGYAVTFSSLDNAWVYTLQYLNGA